MISISAYKMCKAKWVTTVLWLILLDIKLYLKLLIISVVSSLVKLLLQGKCMSHELEKLMSVIARSKIPPCKVLVIGAGVAGLSAIATVRVSLFLIKHEHDH